MSLRHATRAGPAIILFLVATFGCGEKRSAPKPEPGGAPTPEPEIASSPVDAPEGATPESEPAQPPSGAEPASQPPAQSADDWDAFVGSFFWVGGRSAREFRVFIYWANSIDWPIYSQTQAYPDGYAGERADVSIEGAHIAMKINGLRIENASFGNADLNRLAGALRELFAMDARPVEIDARASVPFRWVIGAMDACARARIDSVAFGGVPELKPLDPCTILLDDRKSLDARDALAFAMPFSLTARPETPRTGRRPRIVVNVLLPGETIVAERRVLKPEALDAFIGSRAKGAGTDDKGRPRLGVRVRCDAGCTFQPVLQVMHACAKAGITDVTFASRSALDP